MPAGRPRMTTSRLKRNRRGVCSAGKIHSAVTGRCIKKCRRSKKTNLCLKKCKSGYTRNSKTQRCRKDH